MNLLKVIASSDDEEFHRLVKTEPYTKREDDDYVYYTIAKKKDRPPLSLDRILQKIFVWPSPTKRENGVEYFGASPGKSSEYSHKLLTKEGFKKVSDNTYIRGDTKVTLFFTYRGTVTNSVLVEKI